jgi:hypothetical protein
MGCGCDSSRHRGACPPQAVQGCHARLERAQRCPQRGRTAAAHLALAPCRPAAAAGAQRAASQEADAQQRGSGRPAPLPSSSTSRVRTSRSAADLADTQASPGSPLLALPAAPHPNSSYLLTDPPPQWAPLQQAQLLCC